MDTITRRGLMLVLSSPSGSGKTTIAQSILKLDKHIHSSISVTTRPIRKGEIDGYHYHFVSKEEFLKMIEEDQFLEYAEVFGQMYGTPKSFVENMLAKGEDVLFDIDWQGHNSLRNNMKEDVISIFIFPPSKKELLNRLIARGDDSSTVEYRMSEANKELSHWTEYDYSIINRDIDESLSKVLSILRAERLRKARRLGVCKFVAQLIDEEV